MKLENKKGISLIETLLYVAIMGIFVAAMVSFVMTNKKVSKRNEVVSEVEFNAQSIVEIISQATRNAKSINTPTLQSSAQQLSLVTDVASENPTIISLSAGKITIKRGNGVAVALNTDKIVISNLIFNNFGNVGTLGSINFQFDAKYLNPSNAQELNFSKTFFGTASIR
ncbi:MAG: type II secretion system protein [bacterium]